MDDEQKAFIAGAIIFILSIAGVIALFMWGMPTYHVYSAKMEGMAQLAQADQNRQILVTQAQAEKEAATLRAEAIAIVGAKAKEFPEYRAQEFIGAFAEALKDGHISQIIYVPTEANIPIIEKNTRN